MNESISKLEPKYLYFISHRREFAELCAMEMRYIFGKISNSNYHLTNQSINISRSSFIKGQVTILYFDKNINTIEKKMIEDNLSFDNYKIHFSEFDAVPYQIRLQLMRTLGFTINGDFAIKDPDVEFILTKIDGIWIFGTLKSNPNKWLERRQKPYNYSHALDVKLAKAVINIAINNNFDLRVIDPCCGIGTILIEGRTIGIDIEGYEINPLVKQHCNINLEYFGFEPNVKKIDMLTTTNHFEVAILDLPYGQSSQITKEEQIALIRKTGEISDKAVIITMDDMSDIIQNIGLKIIDTCIIKKSNTFSRYVMVCI
ncbi:MAG: SAM-dependent methyltransferase [Candidatus Izimaplasma sp.]|nr:SAM-dependent methyltransferase [Candidatus Izimaplasma bacterium]